MIPFHAIWGLCWYDFVEWVPPKDMLSMQTLERPTYVKSDPFGGALLLKKFQTQGWGSVTISDQVEQRSSITPPKQMPWKS